MRLIDADELKAVYIPSEIEGFEKMMVPVEVVLQNIDDMPTVDAVPARHGRWITHHEKVALLNGEASGGVYCSECEYKTHNKLHLILGCPFKYCPNCCARMDGKGDRNDGKIEEMSVLRKRG